jgi:hypothetical protein
MLYLPIQFGFRLVIPSLAVAKAQIGHAWHASLGALQFEDAAAYIVYANLTLF